jgi:hypothetical protein
VDFLHVGQEIRLFSLQEVIEIFVRDDAHKQHVEVIQLFGIRSLQIRKRLMLTLDFEHLLAKINCDEISYTVPQYNDKEGSHVEIFILSLLIRKIINRNVAEETLAQKEKNVLSD